MKKKLTIFLAICFFVALAVLFLSSFNPGKYLVGWDNFSVSLDTKNNFFRTVFSTWRGYRGLGVPGDSESVDIFRIMLQAFLGAFLPANMIDQVYYIALYGLGIVGFYFLSKEVLKKYKSSAKVSHEVVLAAAMGAIIYAFNFHAFETFFLPIAMYVARYAFFPVILLSIIKILQAKKQQFRYILLFVVANLLGSTAYLTATVFFTLMLLLMTLLFSYTNNVKKVFGLLFIIVILNLFWLLPFANYAFQKGDILPLASSFVSVNESLLNKPVSESGWVELLTYEPLTLRQRALPFTDMTTNTPVSIDPILEVSRDDFKKVALLAPMVLIALAIFGISNNVVRTKKSNNLWLLVLLVGSLILLRRSLPPFGPLYDMISNEIPLFAVVFRFSGAKIFPLLLISAGLLASIGFYLLLSSMSQQWKKQAILPQVTLFFALVFIIASPFFRVFSKGLFSSLVRTDIPDAYFQASEYLNETQGFGRVLHLPFDQFSYWRSHTWGYFGSTFLSFLLERPLIDRTFEPGSLENDYYFVELQNQILNASVDSRDLIERSERVYRLFESTATRYVLYDPSVSPNISEEGLQAWGVFNSEDAKVVIDTLQSLGNITKVEEYSFPAAEGSLQVYETKASPAAARFISSATSIDQGMENGFVEPLLSLSEDYFQGSSKNFLTFPFWNDKKKVSLTTEEIIISYPIEHDGELEFKFDENSTAEYFTDVFVGSIEDGIVLSFRPRPLPINFAPDTNSTVQITLENRRGGSEKLAIYLAGEIVQIPNDINTEEKFLGTFLLPAEGEIKLLSSAGTKVVDTRQMELTRDPNCYADAGSEYAYSYDEKDFVATTTDGTTCLTMPLIHEDLEEGDDSEDYFFESTVAYSLKSENMANPNMVLEGSKLQNEIEKKVSSLQDFVGVEACLLDIDSGECLNGSDYLEASSNIASFRITSQKGSSRPQAQLLLVTDADANQQAIFDLDSVAYDSYTVAAETSYQISNVSDSNYAVNLDAANKIVLSIPISQVGKGSKDGQNFLNSHIACSQQNPNATGLIKSNTDESILLYVEDCTASLVVDQPADRYSNFLWLTEYKVFSGRHPKLQVVQGESELYNQYLSRFNRYPNIPGFKQLDSIGFLQDPGVFVEREISENDYWLETGFINSLSGPNFAGAGEQNLSFQLLQYGEGPGLLGVRKMLVLPIPEQWRNMTITQGNPNFSFRPASVLSTQELLPSLWQISLDTTQDNGNQENDQEGYLFEFSQAYDKQWQIFETKNVLDAIIGRNRIQAEHVKVNGWSNGWIIPQNEFDQEMTTFYVFYIPERVALLGWVTTIGGTIIILFSALRSRQTKSKFFKKFFGIKDYLKGKEE